MYRFFETRKASSAPWCGIAIATFLALSIPAMAQTFDSGSTGADGALILTEPGTVIFDPASFDPPLDPEGDNIYHFTEILIGEGVTVRLNARQLGSRPVYWLATGDVVIDGSVDLSGEDGALGTEPRIQSQPGPGGFPGGLRGEYSLLATRGQGPGAGGRGVTNRSGGGAGHAESGDGLAPGNQTTARGIAYGNSFLIPLIGGSGGGGAGYSTTHELGGGGGAGGGALLIAAASITLPGRILAVGGGGAGISGVALGGGCGSGGSIRLMAPLIEGSGEVDVSGGTSGCLYGSPGRISFESSQYEFSGQTQGVVRRGPILRPVFHPSESTEAVRLARIDGVEVPAAPRGSWHSADLVVDSQGETLLEVEARGVPLGTVVDLVLVDEVGVRLDLQSTPLEGTLELSTATATVELPAGFSQFTVQASWPPTL